MIIIYPFKFKLLSLIILLDVLLHSRSTKMTPNKEWINLFDDRLNEKIRVELQVF